MDKEKVENLRQSYNEIPLDIADVAADPITQFGRWFSEALKSDILEPNAMHLSTTTSKGRPSGRIVLLKGFDEAGFVFYSNYKSRKATELEANPYAALTFWWDSLQRQVRIEGTVSRVNEDVSTAYFQSRPRGSQIGAWASPQSQVIQDRDSLAYSESLIRDKFKHLKILPRPDHWGGYVVQPVRVEFWQGRANRLHDRIRYVQHAKTDEWRIERLAP